MLSVKSSRLNGKKKNYPSPLRFLLFMRTSPNIKLPYIVKKKKMKRKMIKKPCFLKLIKRALKMR